MTIKDYFDDPERPGFYSFGRRIDAALVDKCGLGALDLPDQDYSSHFEDCDRDEAGCIPDNEIDRIRDEILEEVGF